MTAKPSASRLLAIALLLAAFLVPASAHAIVVKKEMNTGGGGGGGGEGPAQKAPSRKNPLTSAQQKALFDTVANDSDKYLSEESEKKANGKPYIDLERASFSYVPKGDNIEAKLTASEYKPDKNDLAAKGKPTGDKKELVFTYKMNGTKFTQTEEPKWQDVAPAPKKK